MSNRVLVTGGTGFLAKWVLVELLRRGHEPVTTVRDLARTDDVRAAIAAAGQDAERVHFVPADLLTETGWDVALTGMDAVIHTASPMQGADVITPARRGTSIVLDAARRAGVARIVLTSSLEAAIPPDQDTTADAGTWSDLHGRDVSDYRRAKTLAETDAWEFAARHAGLGLTTVLPGFMQGPTLDAAVGGSTALIVQLLRGDMPGLPRIGFPFVDVRDIAALHVDALETPAGAARRYLAGGPFLWLTDVARILREEVPALAGNVPRMQIPDTLVRAGALVSSDLRSIAPQLGKRYVFDSTPARDDFGRQPRPVAQTLADTARSLDAAGLLN